MVSGNTIIEEAGIISNKTDFELLPVTDVDLRLLDFPIDTDTPKSVVGALRVGHQVSRLICNNVVDSSTMSNFRYSFG